MWWALVHWSLYAIRFRTWQQTSLISPGSILLLRVNMSIPKWILHFHGCVCRGAARDLWFRLSQQLLWGWIAMRLNRDCTCPVLDPQRVKTSFLWVSPHVISSVSVRLRHFRVERNVSSTVRQIAMKLWAQLCRVSRGIHPSGLGDLLTFLVVTAAFFFYFGESKSSENWLTRGLILITLVKPWLNFTATPIGWHF